MLEPKRGCPAQKDMAYMAPTSTTSVRTEAMREPMIIAEAGVNHDGELERALDMVRVAAEAGADAIKFQAFRAGHLVAAGAATADYQAANTGVRDQRALLGRLELDEAAFAAIAKVCAARGIEFLCTPFDVEMTETLIGLGMRRIKVASGELTNGPALRRFARLGVPIVLSTGMATLAEVGRALATLDEAGASEITLLHCTSLYPAPVAGANLRAMVAMRDAFARPVGYSDHTLGEHVAIAAVALGATVIEKHFTLSRALPGPDQAASMEPEELARFVRHLRETASALGDGIKRPTAEELDVAALVRRSWHAAHALSAGALLGEADISLKRPADGLAPEDMPLGRRLARARAADEPIRPGDLVAL